MPYVGQKPADIISTAVDTVTGAFSGAVTVDGAAILNGGIDVAGDLTLDVDGEDIKLLDAGTQWGQFSNSSTNFVMFSPVQDKDIIFKGKDGSDTITALTLDMSEDGHATFKNGVTLTDGNLVVASGHGIDFSATGNISGTSSELLSDYEEGTWTPTLQNYAGTPAIESAIYTKVGRLVYASCAITLDGTSDASGFVILTLPFTALNTDSSAQGGVVTYTDSDKDDITILMNNNSAAASIMQTDGSTYTYNEFGNDKQLRCIIIYSAA